MTWQIRRVDSAPVSNPRSRVPVLQNPKHEAFAQAVANGASAAEAYRKHVSKRGSDAAVETHGPELARKSQVKVRIAELKAAAAEKAGMTRAQAVDFCVRVINSPPSEASMDNPLCEIKMSKAGPYAAFPSKSEMMTRLAKMLGWDEPEKHEMEINVIIGGNAETHDQD